MGIIDFEIAELEASNTIETPSNSCETKDVRKKSKLEKGVFTERLSEYSIELRNYSFGHQLYTILACTPTTSKLFFDFKLVSRTKY